MGVFFKLLEDRPSMRAGMRQILSEPIVCAMYVLTALTPRIDVQAFMSAYHGSGVEAVALIKVIESVAVTLIPMTPLVYVVSTTYGNVDGAIYSAALIMVCWLAMPFAGTVGQLHVLVVLRSAVNAVYDPSIKSIMISRDGTHRRNRGDLARGAAVGLQQSLKGMTQVFASWLGAYLSSMSPALPVYMSAAVFAANAFAIFLFSGRSRGKEHLA